MNKIIIPAIFLFLFGIPRFVFALSCSVEPFSQSVVQGEQVVYTVILTASTTQPKRYSLKTGDLPTNVIRGFIPPTFSDLLPKNINLAFETNDRSQLGPIGMSVFFRVDDEILGGETKCLFEIVIKRKTSENGYLMQTKSRVNMKNTVPAIGNIQEVKLRNTTTSINIPSTRRLAFGSRGEQVVELQKILQKNRYLKDEDMITGYYGIMTRNAVKLLQIENGLEPVGEVGPLTREIINKLK